ncbi:hypothetical protein IAD21_06296 [Abditibacteriota bacterium]|nr:hypothetical protein IAD21_06296 [Abditibacteriota bacterium]
MNTSTTVPTEAATPPAKKILSYSDIRNVQRTHPLQKSLVPVEHAVSLPIPTKRAGHLAYAFFAAPAARQPGKPMRQGAPDRWWLLDAHGSASVIIYALCAVQPFATETWGAVTLPPVAGSLADLKAALANLESQMNALTPVFFAGDAGDASAKQELSAALMAVLSEPLQPQYRALAPDFFAWLES